MNHHATDAKPADDRSWARVLLHPALFRAGSRTLEKSEMSAEQASLVRSRRGHGNGWLLNGEELFNGCILELRLGAPAIWMQVRIEGLPASPTACFHLSNGKAICVPLEGGSVLRWPAGGVDRLLFSRALGDPPLRAKPGGGS